MSFRSLTAAGGAAVFALTGCGLVPEQSARWDVDELEVSRSCNLSNVALDFSQGARRDLGSDFYQMTVSPDGSEALVLNTATGCLDKIRSDSGPMEIDGDLRDVRLSAAGEQLGFEAFEATYAACEARIELGELAVYKAAKEAELQKQTQDAIDAGVVLEQATVCDIYVHDMQLWMRLHTASHTYLYASVGETLIVEEILPE